MNDLIGSVGINYNDSILIIQVYNPKFVCKIAPNLSIATINVVRYSKSSPRGDSYISYGVH